MADAPRIRPAGDRAILVELAGNAAVHAAAAMVRERFGGAVQDVVAGHTTLLVTWPRPPVDAVVVQALREVPAEVEAATSPRSVTIAVRYDGPDLEAVAELTGLSPEEVARRHAAAAYRVAFVGFVPGFAYLIGGDPRLHVPRRDDPRERVPAGSVALAGEYASVYPSASPGGWRLIGTTEERMFDPGREPPALLEPGVAVAFEAVGG